VSQAIKLQFNVFQHEKQIKRHLSIQPHSPSHQPSFRIQDLLKVQSVLPSHHLNSIKNKLINPQIFQIINIKLNFVIKLLLQTSYCTIIRCI